MTVPDVYRLCRGETDVRLLTLGVVGDAPATHVETGKCVELRLAVDEDDALSLYMEDEVLVAMPSGKCVWDLGGK